jgi:adenine deaminase
VHQRAGHDEHEVTVVGENDVELWVAVRDTDGVDVPANQAADLRSRG